jgi:hypothetical protein
MLKSDVKTIEIEQKAFNICLEDFKKRGVGYCVLDGLEFNLIMHRDLSLMVFKVINPLDNFKFKIIKEFKPSQEQLNKYKLEFLE